MLVLCRRLQELEEETAALKRQLSSASPSAPSNPLPSEGAVPPRQEEDVNVSSSPAVRTTRRNETSVDRDPTLSRTIDGLELVPSIIDDCFELYVFSLLVGRVVDATQILQRLSPRAPNYRT